MKRYHKALFSLLTAVWLTTSAWSQSWLPVYNELLTTYQSDSGIDYTAWKANAADLEKLNSVVTVLAKQTPPDTNDAKEIAYYANAYNILVLHGVLSETPLKSVKDIAFNFGFFSKKNHNLGGEKVSLNDIEKIRLLKQFGDARIHFIVNCASVSCPPLHGQALTADNLEAVMEQSIRHFVNSNPQGIRQQKGNHYLISQLFDWYQQDFVKYKGSVLEFINEYRTQKIPKNAKISHLDYSWELNQSR